jgi:hypothetical protein
VTHSLSRRSILVLPLAAGLYGLTVPAGAAMRTAVKGIATKGNFPRLAGFVAEYLDKGEFGMDVFLPNEAAGLFVEGSTPLVMYRDDTFERAQRGEEAIQLSALSGFHRTKKGVYFGGIYSAEYAGLHQGITAILIKPVRTGQDIVDEIANLPDLVELG